ncbi:MAG: hypothetical protein ABFS56_34940 [Pseudomonadota bacterium]
MTQVNKNEALSVLTVILKSRAKWRKSINTGLERFEGYLKIGLI